MESTQRELTKDAGASPFADVELKITGRHGPTSWDAVLEGSSPTTLAKQVLLRAASGREGLAVGQRLRILEAHIAAPDAESEPQTLTVITLGQASEAFVVI